MAVVVDDVDRAGVYAQTPQGRPVQPAATNRHSHTSTRRWCIGGLAVKQGACDNTGGIIIYPWRNTSAGRLMPSNPALRNREPARALTIDGFLARSAAGSSTIAFYGDELRRFERKVGAPLGTAPTKALERLKAELRPTKGGPTRCRLLRQFYTAARQPDRADIFRLKRKDSRLSADEILTRPEINRMIAAARSLRDRALLVVVWETGARISEILHLDVRHVRKETSKEGREIIHVDFREVKVKGEERTGYVIEGVSHVRAWL